MKPIHRARKIRTVRPDARMCLGNAPRTVDKICTVRPGARFRWFMSRQDATYEIRFMSRQDATYDNRTYGPHHV